MPRTSSLDHIVAGRPQVREGDRFGRWTVKGVPFVLPIVAKTPARRQFAVCQCECGTLQVVKVENLRSGKSKGCGCIHSTPGYKHGGCGTRLHRIWLSMNARCTYPSCESWLHYGGRGITVCAEWAADFVPFRDWAMANGYDDKLSIDRIDVNGNYEPSNCQWATSAEQVRNRRVTIVVSAFGETKTAAEWSRDIRCVAPYRTLVRRLNHGVPAETAITTPGAIDLKRETSKCRNWRQANKAS